MASVAIDLWTFMVNRFNESYTNLKLRCAAGGLKADVIGDEERRRRSNQCDRLINQMVD